MPAFKVYLDLRYRIEVNAANPQEAREQVRALIEDSLVNFDQMATLQNVIIVQTRPAEEQVIQR